MKQETLKFHITGIRPLLMESAKAMFVGQDPAVDAMAAQHKKLRQKRLITEADQDEIYRLEYLLALYLQDGAPSIPGEVVEGSLFGTGGAAGKTKGVTKKDAAMGVSCFGFFPLQYDGPKDPLKLALDPSFTHWARTTRGIVIVRPKFSDWEVDIELNYYPDVVDEEIVLNLIETAGSRCGWMSWRPKFGLFEVERV